MTHSSRPALLPLAALTTIFLALCFMTEVRYRPPAAAPASARDDEFSAERAAVELESLGVSSPRPVGSEQHARMQSSIELRLRALGLVPETREADVCSPSGCARVTNIVATIAGSEPGPTVWLNAHYDSVASGPGVSDDGANVAALLEIARILRGERHTRGITLSFDDGEEAGLLGASALARDPSFASRVFAVVNLEARGTSGPSLMFETSEPNGALMDVYARSVTRPMTSSIYYAAYKLLPNDTDLTVFKAAGARGYGLAFIGDAENYHTARDDLSHLNKDSLQHQGATALELTRGLADARDLEGDRREVVFFDLFAASTARVSTWVVRLCSALALFGISFAASRRRALRAASFAALLPATATFAALCSAALVLVAARALGLVSATWIEHAAPVRASFCLWGFCWVAIVARRFAPASPCAMRLGAWMCLGALGAIAAAFSPGGSYPLVAVASTAALVEILAAAAPSRDLGLWAVLPPFVVGCLLWIPIGWMLYDAGGVLGMPVEAGLAALVAAPASPCFLRRAQGTSPNLPA